MWYRPPRMRGQPAKPHPSAQRAPRRGANGCADERFVVQPSTFRPEAALGSRFPLQAAFWYQNAMLALFLRGKKSLKRSLIRILSRKKFQLFVPRRGARCADMCGFAGCPRIRAGLRHTNATSAHRAAQKNEGWHQASPRLANRTREMIHDSTTQPSITRKIPSASAVCTRYHG